MFFKFSSFCSYQMTKPHFGVSPLFKFRI
uniref:Uncharacterized protein n=1 Tax=Rhizophora mucronata TaxID=61149 RepID=A0A2P2QK00_RHIMU